MNKFALEKAAAVKWFHNLVIFLAPLVVVYLGVVAVSLQSGFDIHAFIPTQATLGAISLYVVNGVMDYLRKLRS